MVRLFGKIVIVLRNKFLFRGVVGSAATSRCRMVVSIPDEDQEVETVYYIFAYLSRFILLRFVVFCN
jgi:hypothetical protein